MKMNYSFQIGIGMKKRKDLKRLLVSIPTGLKYIDQIIQEIMMNQM